MQQVASESSLAQLRTHAHIDGDSLSHAKGLRAQEHVRLAVLLANRVGVQSGSA